MRKHIIYISILVFIGVSFQCSEDTYSNYKRIAVKEYKTGKPLSEAHMSIYICEQPDFVFGCLRIGFFSSCVTDNRGICRIAYPEFHFEHLKVEKMNYWTRLIPIGNDEYAIQPESWVNITLSTNSEYPESTYFFFTVTGEVGFDKVDKIQAVDNTQFILTIFGNEENTVGWSLYDLSDTGDKFIKSGNFSLSPGKFENLVYTLTY